MERGPGGSKANIGRFSPIGSAIEAVSEGWEAGTVVAVPRVEPNNPG